MDLKVLRRELEPFGKVEGISRLRVDKVVTERVNVTMVLAPNKNIPSFLTVLDYFTRLYRLEVKNVDDHQTKTNKLPA